MENTNFTRWCKEATKLIKYKPDQKIVAEELQAHLEDHYDALIAKGLTPDEANKRALTAMGNAEEIAPQLAAIHKPFWGYVLRISKILLVVMICLCAFPLWDYATDLTLYDMPNRRPFHMYDRASYGDGTGRTLLHLSQPNVSFSSDDSTFTLLDAAVFTETYADGTVSDPQLSVLIRQTSLLPWAEHEEYCQYFPITSCFHAKDSLGNEYSDLFAGGVQCGVFTYLHECCVYQFSSDAEWVEICYERDGRSFSLRIDLTGGDGV